MIKGMQKLKQKNNKEIISQHKKLSIQFSLDGFSFCIKDIPTNETLVVTEYVFKERLNTPNLLLEKINQVFESDKDLQANFEKVTAVHQNKLSTIVPNDLFDEDHLKSYLNYTIQTLSSDLVVYDDLNFDAKIVYIPYVNVNNFLFQNFGEFEFKHHSTLFIDEVLKQKEQFKDNAIFVNVSYANMDVVILKNREFNLYNSFFYNTKEDFIYYVLFCIEQLELDPNELTLYFSGNIINDYEIYKISQDYIKNIEFLKPNHDFFEKSEYFFKHSHYTLLS